MKRKGGRRLSIEHKAFLIERLCEGRSNGAIQQEMASLGYPIVSAETLRTYRNQERVKAAQFVCLQHARLCGIASRLIRIRSLEVLAGEYLLRTRGFTPSPMKPGDSLAGPPVPPDNLTFRTLCDGMVAVFRELDRTVYPEEYQKTIAGKVVAGSATMNALAKDTSPEVVPNNDDMQVLFNDIIADALAAYTAHQAVDG
jgi:hypothetical protein